MKKTINLSLKKGLLVFSHWNRKGYSVFNTLHKIVKIATLSLAYTIVLLPKQVLCQTDTVITKNLDLEEIVVSAQRAPVMYSQLSRLITTIDEEEISLMPVSSVNELLENFSGIDIRQRGVNGVQADISLRGGSFDQNLILLNGINITDPQTGHHSLNLPIALNSIERIEILEGPGSRVFGPNAFSGAINIITNQSDKNTVKANISAGDFGLFEVALENMVNYKKAKYYIAISNSKSNGYRENTDFDLYNVFFNSQYNSIVGKIDFQFGYTNKKFGANSFYTPAYPYQYEQTRTSFTSLKFETGNKIKLTPAVYFRRHIDRFELFREDYFKSTGDYYVRGLTDTAKYYPGIYESWNYYSGHNYHVTDIYGIKLDSRISTKLGVTSFGAEIRSENIWSNVLGELSGDTIKAFRDPDGFYTRKYSRTLSNYFLEHSAVIGKFSITAGLLAGWLSDNDFEFNIYPGIDIGYDVFNGTRVYVTINKSLRVPTFTDLFYNGPSNIGNPGLKPEKAWSYELGFKLNNKNYKADASFFIRDAKNLIAWVKPDTSEASSKWETQNLTNVSTLGFEINNRMNINKYSINYITISYAYLNQDVSAKGYNTKYSLNYLKHNLIFNVNHKITKNILFSWGVKYQDRAGSYLNYDKNIRDYTGDKEFKPFWLVDAKLSWKYKFATVYAEATNVFDNTYVDIENIEMPGRWFKVGLHTQIGY